MKVLLTNNRLDMRGGTGPFLRDWSEGMRARGHEVCCFSTAPVLEDRLDATDLLPIERDLGRLPFVPDVIHAQHHIDAMTALSGLPGIPAIYFSHGAVWQECPPIHPRIYEYLVVSDTAAERMAVEFNIPPASSHVFLNTVNVDRFATVRRLPERPSRALFFNYRHTLDSATVLAATAAAERCGLSLDVVGNVRERQIQAPETVLPTYDIVFASGVSAIDALASGCAVVVLGRTSCGELVLPDNYARYRRANFSIAVNSPPPDAVAIEAQLRRYSADACAHVSAQLRRDADHRAALPVLEALYQQAIKRHLEAGADPRADLQAMAAYLQRLTPLVALTDARMAGRWDLAGGVSSDGEWRRALADIDDALCD